MSKQLPTGLAYVGTPYTRYKDGNLYAAYQEACCVSAQLIRMGIKVFSPIAHSHSIGVWGDLPLDDHSMWMEFDKTMMEKADCLIVVHLEGWQQSVGIAEEIKYFAAALKPIYNLDPASFEITRYALPRPPRERYEGVSESEHKRRKNAYLHGEPP
jgi:hypothetical protein